MLHFSAIINWNASERNIEPVFEVNFSIHDGENIGFKFYIILIHRTEFGFPFIQKSKRKDFSSILHFFTILKFKRTAYKSLEKTTLKSSVEVPFFKLRVL